MGYDEEGRPYHADDAAEHEEGFPDGAEKTCADDEVTELLIFLTNGADFLPHFVDNCGERCNGSLYLDAHFLVMFSAVFHLNLDYL